MNVKLPVHYHDAHIQDHADIKRLRELFQQAAGLQKWWKYSLENWAWIYDGAEPGWRRRLPLNLRIARMERYIRYLKGGSN